MKEHGRAFQCEPCRQTIIFFAVSDASPYIAAGRVLPSSKMSVVPLIALGTMASHQLRQRADGRADDPTAVLQEV
jgi:hypothetical protein